MKKQDITEYSDSELSLIVMNDESLYRMRRRPNLRAELEGLFIFTENQWDELENDLTYED